LSRLQIFIKERALNISPIQRWLKPQVPPKLILQILNIFCALGVVLREHGHWPEVGLHTHGLLLNQNGSEYSSTAGDVLADGSWDGEVQLIIVARHAGRPINGRDELGNPILFDLAFHPFDEWLKAVAYVSMCKLEDRTVQLPRHHRSTSPSEFCSVLDSWLWFLFLLVAQSQQHCLWPLSVSSGQGSVDSVLFFFLSQWQDICKGVCTRNTANRNQR